MHLAFRALGCNMSIKLHFLNSHLDQFLENLGTMNYKQGEGFHWDLKTMVEHYQVRWDKSMMADYCWCIRWDCPEDSYNAKLQTQIPAWLKYYEDKCDKSYKL